MLAHRAQCRPASRSRADKLSDNVENLVGTGSAQALTGNKLANTITAGRRQRHAHRRRLRYLQARGRDGPCGGQESQRRRRDHRDGEVDFGTGITGQNLWFLRGGNDLQIDLMGTTDHLTVGGWCAGNARAQVQSFDTADGLRLDSQVAQLVSAMASFSSANPGFDPTTATQVPSDPALQSVVAAAWHG